MKHLLNLLLLVLITGSILTFTSCGEDEEPIFADPTLSFSSGDATALQPGNDIEVDLSIAAEGGLSSIIVNRNGGFLEEVELTDRNATMFTYTGQTVPEDAEEASEIVYEFIGENTQGARSTPITYTITVNAYDEISVGGTTLFNLIPAIPADGVVKSGTTIKLAAGRSYYFGPVGLPEDTIQVIFENGSNFIVEEGVTVYMQSEVDFFVSIRGTVNIEGTATEPVVFTSENVLNTGTDASFGDWESIEVNGEDIGNNSGILKYIRFEYGNDRVLELDDVGSDTEVSHIQIWGSVEDAFFVSGNSTVNISYMVITEAGDIGYRLGDNYTGNMQFLIAYSELTSGGESFYIREAANLTISNVTVVMPGSTGDLEKEGVRFNSSSGSKMYNAVVTGTQGMAVEAGNVTPTNIDGDVVFAYAHVYDNDDRDDGDANIFFEEASFNVSEDPIAGIAPGSIIPDASATSSFNPTTLGNFFQSGSFIGAIENAANDWTVGWVKNPDGTIR